MVYFSFSSNLYIFFNLLPQIGPQILDINVYERFFAEFTDSDEESIRGNDFLL